jgi:membrane protease YdiL (CAAX protease family)
MEGAAASSPVQNNSVSKPSRRRDWTEIGVAYALIMAVEWTPRPLQRVLWVVAAVGIVVIFWRSFDGWAAMGLRKTNLGRSLWIAGAALVLAGAAVVVAARMHTLLLPGGPFTFVGTYIAYAIWTGLQQFLLQGFFLLRFLRVISNERLAASAAAVLFASAHLPNPILVPATLIWGFVACLLFLRYRNLYPLMIAHAILGITVAMTIPGPVVHNMRVGLGYLTYRPHLHGHAQRAHPLAQP